MFVCNYADKVRNISTFMIIFLIDPILRSMSFRELGNHEGMFKKKKKSCEFFQVGET